MTREVFVVHEGTGIVLRLDECKIVFIDKENKAALDAVDNTLANEAPILDIIVLADFHMSGRSAQKYLSSDE